MQIDESKSGANIPEMDGSPRNREDRLMRDLSMSKQSQRNITTRMTNGALASTVDWGFEVFERVANP